MTDYKIKVGDKVQVLFEHVSMISEAIVLYIPSATGDCWHLRDETGDAIHYIQLFSKMTKL